MWAWESMITGSTFLDEGHEFKLQGHAAHTRLNLSTPQGYFSCELSEIPGVGALREFPVTGIDAAVAFQRYPDEVQTTDLSTEFLIEPSEEERPYFIKIIQTDGHMAWCSPFYVAELKKT